MNSLGKVFISARAHIFLQGPKLVGEVSHPPPSHDHTHCTGNQHQRPTQSPDVAISQPPSLWYPCRDLDDHAQCTGGQHEPYIELFLHRLTACSHPMILPPLFSPSPTPSDVRVYSATLQAWFNIKAFISAQRVSNFSLSFFIHIAFATLDSTWLCCFSYLFGFFLPTRNTTNSAALR
jgi:hypothetical protein